MTAEVRPPPFDFESFAEFVLKENFHKQELAIEAIEDSAYVVRHGRRELQDPKRLALAVELRRKFMTDLAALSGRIREAQRIQAYIEELFAALGKGIEGESPESKMRLARLLSALNEKYAITTDVAPAPADTNR